MESESIPPVIIAYRFDYGGIAERDILNFDSDRILVCKTFSIEKVVGSFFSCIYQGKLRIHVVFNEDTDSYNEEITELIMQSMETTGISHGMIWFKHINKSIIEYISKKVSLTPDSEQFFYDSTEYIMRRKNFNKALDNTVLNVKPFEEIHIDKYLELLNDSMAFFIPPEDFVDKKDRYAREFMEFHKKRAFEAFWKNGRLVGLYWISGTEVDTMGVSTDFQRLGYGSIILTRAIETIFTQNPGVEYATLYAVGWNAKAQSFYRKYGMEEKAQHRVPYDVVNPV